MNVRVILTTFMFCGVVTQWALAQSTFGTHWTDEDTGCVLDVWATLPLAEVASDLYAPYRLTHELNADDVDQLMADRAALVASVGCADGDYDCFFELADDSTQDEFAILDQLAISLLFMNLDAISDDASIALQDFVDFMGDCKTSSTRTIAVNDRRVTVAPADPPPTNESERQEKDPCKDANSQRKHLRRQAATLTDELDKKEREIFDSNSEVASQTEDIRENGRRMSPIDQREAMLGAFNSAVMQLNQEAEAAVIADQLDQINDALIELEQWIIDNCL